MLFRLVFDRETGKPKGYGFCEYRDQETALSAMRNLNGYEIGGRNLKEDNACTEKSRMEMQNLLNQPPVENPYGEPIQSEKAPEAISKAVASLPPEQMFELMKQMKSTIQVSIIWISGKCPLIPKRKRNMHFSLLNKIPKWNWWWS